VTQHSDKLEELRKRISDAEKIEKIFFRNGKWQISATYGTLSTHCPSCNGLLTHHDWSNSRFLDAPISGEIVYLHVKRPRYRCKACQKTLTPVILDVTESYRVTNRLVDYIKNNLWYSNSLRELAASVGSTAKTISQLLKTIANQAKLAIETPSALGIHELILKKQRHLILSNLDKGTVVDFLPDSPNQLDHLASQLICFNQISPIKLVSLPADQAILKKVVHHCPAAEIEFTLSSINSVLAKAIIKQSVKSSKKGKLGSVSKNEAHRLTYSRKAELAENDVSLFLDGIKTKNEFWEIFEAKEQLLSRLAGTKSINWIETYRSWILNLPLPLRPIFHDVSLLFNEIERLQVKLFFEPALASADKNILVLQNLLLKPGKSFSPEMISALVLASPFLQVPIARKVGMKGAGPLWIERSVTEVNLRIPRTAGISINDLVNILHVIWNKTKIN
jgi:transposase